MNKLSQKGYKKLVKRTGKILQEKKSERKKTKEEKIGIKEKEILNRINLRVCRMIDDLNNLEKNVVADPDNIISIIDVLNDISNKWNHAQKDFGIKILTRIL